MRAYSEDLRKKIVTALGRGMSKAEAARTFDVSLSSVKRYARSVRQGGSLAPKKSPGRPRIVDEKAQVLLEEDVKERPAATISQRRRFLEHITATDMSDSTVRRLERVMNLGENRIGKRILRLARSPAVPRFPHSQAIPDRVHNSL